MRQITLSELQDIMHECAGWAQPLEQAPDEPFDELGYDSLALLEAASRIKRDCASSCPRMNWAAPGPRVSWSTPLTRGSRRSERGYVPPAPSAVSRMH